MAGSPPPAVFLRNTKSSKIVIPCFSETPTFSQPVPYSPRDCDKHAERDDNGTSSYAKASEDKTDYGTTGLVVSWSRSPVVSWSVVCGLVVSRLRTSDLRPPSSGFCVSVFRRFSCCLCISGPSAVESPVFLPNEPKSQSSQAMQSQCFAPFQALPPTQKRTHFEPISGFSVSACQLFPGNRA